MKYKISGFVVFGKNDKRPFTKTIEANTENFAIHKLYSIFGSLNKVKRSKIEIKEVNKSE